MIGDKKILAVIPARGGSKGVLRKNIRIVAGKPLIAWTIEEAKKSSYIDKLILSSEDEEIIYIAKRYGCDVPFTRPQNLACDDTPGIDPVLHAIEYFPDYEYVVLLQPTSPLRSVEDIDNCIERCFTNKAYSCVSVVEPDMNPYWIYTLNDEQRMVRLLDVGQDIQRRQDLPHVFGPNGAVYVAEADWIRRNRSFLAENAIPYLMPRERSIDIDSEEDLLFAQRILMEGHYGKTK